MYIDKNVSFADLKQTLLYLARELLEPKQNKVTPIVFPFTEPSAEVDVTVGFVEAKDVVFVNTLAG